MIDTTLDFSALLDISNDLAALSKAENNRVLRQATRAAAVVIRDEARARAPRRTGKLARNIVVANGRTQNGDVVSGVNIRTKGKPSNPNNAFYWGFVELGTSRMAAHPFVRPAFDAKEQAAADAAFAKANEAIDKVLSS